MAPSWPLDADSQVSDERAAAAICRACKLSEGDYWNAVALADHYRHEAEFKAAHALLAHTLERVPVLSRSQLARLMGPERLRRWIDNRQEQH